jgi:hypothetical protein
MKYKVWRSIAISLCIGVFCASVIAQNETLAAAAGDKYVISAKAGGVNFVQGGVTVSRPDGRGGRLVKGDGLNIGDKVSTSSDGKVEILLNPGSYVRLGGNSTFRFKTTSLDDLQLELDAGSAILEVFAAKEFQVVVSTPRAKYVLFETGIYRVDVSDDKTAQLRVWRGRAHVNDSTDTIKSGRSVTSGLNTQIAVAKFDRDEKDALDDWSKSRGKDLAKISASFQRMSLRTALMRSFLGRRWNMYNSFGLWVFDPMFGGSCFLPFGYGWNSPYGFGYGSYIGWYNLPPVIYYPPPTSGGSGNPNTTRVPINTMDEPAAAPFQKMQRTMGGSVRSGGIDRGGNGNDPNSGSPSPTYNPSSLPSSLPTRSDAPSPPPQPTIAHPSPGKGQP